MENNFSCGITTVGEDDAMGSDYACHLLGFWNFYGKNGILKNETEAKHWLTEALNSIYSKNHSDDSVKEKARPLLEVLKEWR